MGKEGRRNQSSIDCRVSETGQSKWETQWMAPLGTEVDSHVQSCLVQKRPMCGTSLVVHWLRLIASTAENESFIPDKVTKIPHIKVHGKRKVQCEAFMTQERWGNSHSHSHHHYGYVHNGAIKQSPRLCPCGGSQSIYLTIVH